MFFEYHFRFYLAGRTYLQAELATEQVREGLQCLLHTILFIRAVSIRILLEREVVLHKLWHPSQRSMTRFSPVS